MTAPLIAEGGIYRPDGSAICRIGQTAVLELQLAEPGNTGPFTPADLSGRFFVQRLFDKAGAVLVEIEATRPDDLTVRFELTIEEGYLPGALAAADLTHAIVELLDGDQEDDVLTRPFSIRRLRSGLPIARFEIGAPDRLVVRYAGSKGASAAEEMKAAGLIDQATPDALADWLRAPALEAAAAAQAKIEETEAARVAAQAVVDDLDETIAGAGAAQVTAIVEAADEQIANVAQVFGARDYAGNADALSNGVASLAAVVAGTGGTNGTFALGFSGGGGTGAAGVFVVAGGVVVSTMLTAPGRGYTSAPTVSFAASAGLTGASATAVLAQNRPAGTFWRIKAAGGFEVFENVAGTATSRGIYPDKAAVDDVIESLTERTTRGRTVDPITGTSAAAGTFVDAVPMTADYEVETIRVWCATPGATLTPQAWSRSGTTMTLEASGQTFVLSSGLNVLTLTTPLTVLAGQYVGWDGSAGHMTYTSAAADGVGWWGGAAGATSFSDASLDTAIRLQIGFGLKRRAVTVERFAALETGTAEALAAAADGVAAKAALTATSVRGRAVAPITGSNAAAGNYMLGDALTEPLDLWRVRARCAVAGNLTIHRRTRSGTANSDSLGSVVVPLAVGDNTIELSSVLAFAEGEYASLSAAASGVLVFTSNTADGAGYWTGASGSAGFTDATLDTNYRLEIGLDFRKTLDVPAALNEVRAGQGAVAAWARGFGGIDPRRLPGVMTAPPTRTIGAADAVSAITGGANTAVTHAATSASLSRMGGVWAAQSDASYQATQRSGGRVRFMTDAETFELRLRSSTGRGVSVAIDGAFVTDQPWGAGMVPGGNHLVRYDFGTNVETRAVIGLANLTNGGTGHAVGDEITLGTAGGAVAVTPAVLRVAAVASGVITAVTVKTPGVYTTTAGPAQPQASTTGSGTGASFALIWQKLQSTRRMRAIEVTLDFGCWFGGLIVPANTTVSPWPEATKPARLVVAGDSLTEYAFDNHPAGNWSETLANALGLHERFARYGVSGLGWAKTGAQFQSHRANVAALGADVLVIALGVNDKETSTLAATVTARVTADLDYLLASNPNLLIVALTGWEADATYQAAVLDGVAAASDQSRVRGVNLQTHGIYVDDGTGEGWRSTDDLHPGQQGMDNLGRAITPLVAEAIQSMVG
ncbi:SGNH/GDSL hydrolase family protein [Brevundimonas vitis]|uniref:SGNH/GDSL hydrolase family protein n=1 Tax=Brevundimonas vitisensis TaxID=2800818 RepID=A0ABX7BQZ8_9CAUL|nr:SGNH/GDSL hydrolase family protein [Brevundimonas vitisensis]QQQ19682.1 SGNH/GDSL hydrolase family protein [Brevundimonas vitisensis]